VDHRIGYVIGDFLASLITGVVAGSVSWLIVSPSWNMWLAMFAMMFVGMIVGMILFFPFSIKLGAMEAMVPLMFNGMIAGMAVGMSAAMMHMPYAEAVQVGAVSAVGGLFFIWAANAALRGVTRDSEQTGDTGNG